MTERPEGGWCWPPYTFLPALPSQGLEPSQVHSRCFINVQFALSPLRPQSWSSSWLRVSVAAAKGPVDATLWDWSPRLMEEGLMAVIILEN